MTYSFTFNRPLSPHIIIYKSNLVLLRSILHRISGLCLSLIFLVLLLLSEIHNNSNSINTLFFFWYYFSNVFFLLSINLFNSFFVYHSISGLFHFYKSIFINYDF